MVKDNYYFYISGFISLSLFFLVLAGFSYMMFTGSEIKSYALDKKDFISISLDMSKSSSDENSKSTIIEDITTPKQKEENLNIDDLFNDVSTREIKDNKVKTKKIDSKRYNEIARRVKVSKENNVESLTKKIKSANSEDSNKNSNTSSADEVNEYLAKIQAIIYNNFNPPQNTQGKSAQIVIELSAIGKMTDFRILKPSDNESFNEELKKIKQRLRNIVFPNNPNNENYRLITKIISKE
jgi:protein TonB